MALKAHHACMMTDNTSYIIYSASKIMKRLTIQAQFRCEESAPDRGKGLFGAVSLTSLDAQQHSAIYL
jgi:hypothetical protein